MSNDVKIKVTADANQAHNELDKLGKEVGSLENKTDGASQSMDGLSDSVDDAAKSSNKLQKENKKTGDSLADIKKISAAAALAVGSFVVLSTNHLINLNRELKVAERQLGIGSDQLQIWGIASERFNISGQKMRDILKDVSDKFGDFVATGGGEAKDVFEKLNLDIQSMKTLAPDQILLKVAAALDDVNNNVSPNEKVFLMEALANDASRLLPMLENNAQALRDIEEIAQRRGTIITAEESTLLSQADTELRNIKGALGGVAQEAGLIGAELLVAFGPGLANSIDSVTRGIEQITYDLGLIDDAWSATTSTMNQESQEFTGRWVNQWGDASEDVRYLITYVPKWMDAAYLSMEKRGEAWRYNTLSYYELVKSGSAYAFAGMVEYGGSAFASLVDIGGKALGWLIDQFADLIDSMSIIGELPGMESFGAKFDSAANSIRSAANSAKGFGDDVRSSVNSATASIRSNADASLAAAIQYSAQADAASQAASAIMQQASDYIAAKEGQRDIDKQIRDENREFGDMSERAFDQASAGANRFTAAGENAAEAAKSAAKAKDDLAKSAERSAQAFESENQRLQEQYIELTQGEAAAYAYAYAKSLQGISAPDIAKLQAIKDTNAALKEQKEHREEVKDTYESELESLDDQYAKATLSERAYKEHQLATDDLNATMKAEVLARYDVVQAAEDQQETMKALYDDIQDINDNAAKSFVDGIVEGTFSATDILKNWLKDMARLLANNILSPIIQPISNAVSGGVSSLLGGGSSGGSGGLLQTIGGGINPSSATGLFENGLSGAFTKVKGLAFGNQIGLGIEQVTTKMGMTRFIGAGNMSNMAIGGAAALGGVVGGIGQQGTQGATGGALAGGLAMAAGLGPVGIGLAILGGGAVGGLFGDGKVVGTGYELGYSNGGLVGNRYETRNKGWIRGSSDEESDLEAQFAADMNAKFDLVEQTLVGAAEFYGASNAQAFLDSYEVALQKMDDRDLTEEAWAEWFGSVTSGMVTGIFGTGFSKYQRQGEQLSDTFDRIYNATGAMTEALSMLGSTMDITSIASGEAASRVIDLFGGIEQFTIAMDNLQNSLNAQLQAIAASYADAIAEYGRLQTIAVSIRDELSSVRFGSQSGLTIAQQSTASKALFTDTASLASGGDEVAASALIGVEKQYLTLAATQSADAAEYLKAQAYASNLLDTVADNIEALEDPQVQMLAEQKAAVDVAREELEQMLLDAEADIFRNEQLALQTEALYALPEATANALAPQINSSISNAVSQFAFDGSHANGLVNVPFDGYRAELHGGESVIDARSMFGFRKYGIPVSGSSNNAQVVAKLNEVLIELKEARKESSTLRKELNEGLFAVNLNSEKTATIINKWDEDDMPQTRDYSVASNG